MNLILENRINDIKKFPFDIFVYGGPSGSPTAEHGEPHFHFNKKGEWKYSILIPTTNEWNSKKELYISETTDDLYWTGKKKIKKELIEWLDKYNHVNDEITNLEYIKFMWNKLNFYIEMLSKFIKIIK